MRCDIENRVRTDGKCVVCVSFSWWRNWLVAAEPKHYPTAAGWTNVVQLTLGSTKVLVALMCDELLAAAIRQLPTA